MLFQMYISEFTSASLSLAPSIWIKLQVYLSGNLLTLQLQVITRGFHSGSALQTLHLESLVAPQKRLEIHL